MVWRDEKSDGNRDETDESMVDLKTERGGVKCDRWTRPYLEVALKVLTSGAAEDVRSDDEDEDEEPEPKKKK